MKFVECKEGIPKRNSTHKNLRVYFEEFMTANMKIAKIEFNESDYKNILVARSVLHTAIKRHGFPIAIHKRGNELYLERKDIWGD